MQSNFKNVLVLGSSGQIGLPLCETLIRSGYSVTRFDIEESDSHDLRQHNNSILVQAVQESDFVFFLAFDVGGSTYLKTYQNSFEFIQNNLKIISNTFEVIVRYKKPFVYASSQMANMSFSTYGMLKSIGEKITQTQNGRTVHFWNVYGLETNPSKFHVISDFIDMALRTKSINMKTDGQELRDFLYVDDCSKALIAVMENFEHINRSALLHITSGHFTRIIDVAELIGAKQIGRAHV